MQILFYDPSVITDLSFIQHCTTRFVSDTLLHGTLGDVFYGRSFSYMRQFPMHRTQQCLSSQEGKNKIFVWLMWKFHSLLGPYVSYKCHPKKKTKKGENNGGGHKSSNCF